jgi:hypothetical protein
MRTETHRTSAHRTSGAVFVVMVLVAGAATDARAQTDKVLPVSLSLSSNSCESDDEVLIQWTGYSKPNGYFLSVRLEERGVNTSDCPTFGVQAPLHVVEPFATELFYPNNGTLFVERNLTGSDMLGALCTTGVRREALLCLYGSSFTNEPANVNDIDLRMPPVVITFDTDVPDAPSIEGIVAGDRRVIVTFDDVDETAGDTYTYVVQYRACPSDEEDAGTLDAGSLDDAGVLVEEAESLCDSKEPYRRTSGSSSPVTVSGLTNDREYELRVVVEDDFGNASEPSVSLLATPLGERTPLSIYDGTENPFSIEGPTCQARLVESSEVPAAAVVLVLSAALAFRRRKTHPHHRGVTR